MRLKIVLSGLVVITAVTAISFAGQLETDYNNNNFSPFWDFVNDNRPSISANGRGYTGIAASGGIESVIINPASLQLNSKAEVHFELMGKTINAKSATLTNMHEQRSNGEFPLIGIGLNGGECFKTGIVYSTLLSNQMWTIPTRTEVDSLLVPIMYQYDSSLRFGIDIMRDYYSANYPSDINPYEFSNFQQYSVKLGMVISPSDELSFGLTYVPETQREYAKLHGTARSWSSTGGYLTFKEYEKETLILPQKLGFGVKYNFVDLPLSLLYDYNYSNDSRDDNLIDRKDFNFGLEYKIGKGTTFRAGLITQKDYRNMSKPWDDPAGAFDQTIGTLGISDKTDNFTLHLSCEDNSVFGRQEFAITCFRIGFSYEFGLMDYYSVKDARWASRKTGYKYKTSGSTGKTNVAVAEFAGKGVSAADASTISDFLRTQLVKSGEFAIIEKANMNTILAEIAFQQSGCTDSECAVKMGKILNAQYVIVGTVSYFMNTYVLNASIVDVETGQIVRSEKIGTGSIRELDYACALLAKKLTQ